ncbi:MAG: preprotein translocase subunit SecG [Clostridiales bacterium]|nr:preprotein translocase subunit SecG [Clostridiales bacterium]
MTTLQVVFTSLLLLASLALIVSVLLQKGDADGIGALTGGGSGASSFFGKNKTRTLEGRLATLTKGSAIAFVVLGLVLIFI